MAEEKRNIEAELLRCKLNIGNKVHIPIKVMREMGLEEGDYMYMRADNNRGVIILYTQRYFKLVPVGATEDEKKEANSVNDDVGKEEIQED